MNEKMDRKINGQTHRWTDCPIFKRNICSLLYHITNVELSAVFLKNEPLEQVSDYKYLGVILCAGKVLTFSPIASIRSFHRAANAILYSRVKPNNEILLKLLYTNCVPILSYAAAVRDYSASDMYRCHVALNNAIRKIFSFAVWQSIRHLRLSHGYKSLYEIFASAKAKFLALAPTSNNYIVRHLFINLA